MKTHARKAESEGHAGMVERAKANPQDSAACRDPCRVEDPRHKLQQLMQAGTQAAQFQKFSRFVDNSPRMAELRQKRDAIFPGGQRTEFQAGVRPAVVQGVFTFNLEESLAIDSDEKTKTQYRILATIAYGESKEKTAYHLESWDAENTIYVDSQTKQILSPEALGKTEKQQPAAAADDYASDFSDSDDDASSTLTHFGKHRILEKNGARKLPNLAKVDLARDKNSRFPLHRKHQRNALGAIRLSGKKEISDLDDSEKTLIGDQVLSIDSGKGYFIMAGGNKKERTKDMKEPHAEYNGLFGDTLKLGEDEALPGLYEAARSSKWNESKSLRDADVGAMALHYLKSDAQQIRKKFGRTQLTENFGKFAAITDYSEFSRGMSAQRPYDASLLSRHGLLHVANEQCSLEEMYYLGKGGTNSIFMGAPSEKHSEDHIGGSEILRNPRKYPDRMKRQYAIFPAGKKEFKAALNHQKSAAGDKLPLMDAEKLQKIREERHKQAIADLESWQLEFEGAEALIPEEIEAHDQFLFAEDGFCVSMRKRLERIAKALNADDEEAKLKLEGALKDLAKLKEQVGGNNLKRKFNRKFEVTLEDFGDSEMDDENPKRSAKESDDEYVESSDEAPQRKKRKVRKNAADNKTAVTGGSSKRKYRKGVPRK